jgi:AcrR family transcriptional regulator
VTIPLARRAVKAVRTAARRARMPVDARRAQLLDLALRCFAEKSYDEISIDEIARAARISKGLLYHYFPSKRDFYVAGLRHAADKLLAVIEPDVSLPADQRLRAGLRAYLDYVEEFADAYVMLHRGGIGSDVEVFAIVEETRKTVTRRFLEEGMGLTEPRPVFRVALRGWISFVEGASLDWLVARDIDREQLVELLVAALVAVIVRAMALDPAAKVVIPA